MFMREHVKLFWNVRNMYLRVITENDDLQITEVVVPKDYQNLQGRSAVLTVVALNGRE